MRNALFHVTGRAREKTMWATVESKETTQQTAVQKMEGFVARVFTGNGGAYGREV